MTQHRPLPLLELRGNARQRGRIHGEALRPLVVEHLECWKDNLAADTGFDPETYVDEFLADTNFFPAIERWTPDLLEELRGIAEGAGTDFKFTFVRALSDEEPWYRRERRLSAGGTKGCSSLGIDCREDQPTIVAQNMDMPGWCDGYQVLLHIIDPESPVEVFSFTLAGKISLAGMNSAGIGVCCNTLSHLNYARDGLVEDFVVRGFLSRPSLEEGLGFMRSVKHASGQNYTIGGPGSPAYDLECSAGGVSEFRPEGFDDRVFHTNHPLVNDDQSLFRAVAATVPEEDLPRLYHGTSYQRLSVIEKGFGSAVSAPSVATIKEVLSTHPVCRHGELEGRYDHYTIGCLIMELSGKPQLHVAPGPPCCTPFQTFSF
ncbi:MAG: C45 family peptidase [Sterolibacterium sp.]|jgi:hypothetical protein